MLVRSHLFCGVVVLFVGLLCQCCGDARLTIGLRATTLELVTKASDSALAGEIRQAALAAEQRIGLPCNQAPLGPRIRLHTSHKSFEVAAGAAQPAWVRGLVRGNTIHLLTPRRWLPEERGALASVIAHEWAHRVMSDITQHRPVPMEFTEGWVSRVARQASERPSRSALAQVARRRSDLDLLSPLGAPPRWYYTACHYWVVELERRYGRGAMCRVLYRVGAGELFGEAFEGETGAAYEAERDRFVAGLAGSTTERRAPELDRGHESPDAGL